MPLRAAKIQTVKEWCRQTLPLLCLARYLSDRPRDWFFVWVGYTALRSSATTLFRGGGEQKRMLLDLNVGGGKEADKKAGTLHDSSERLQYRPLQQSDGPLSLSLTTLPSEVLSTVGSYLHPKDLLVLDTIFQAGNSNGSKTNSMVLNDVWKRIWYRDYGDVLLRWKVSREALERSLMELSSKSKKVCDCHDVSRWIDEQLSDHLDAMSAKSANSMKDFYFTFGECYMDYILARKNKIDECYMGLHGHIFDFTNFAEYHPGLIEPILKECAGDATYYFEDVPHSKGARNIARRLCVVVDHGLIDYNHRFGLELVCANDSAEREKLVLQSSNTRPLSSMTKGKGRWASHILPQRRHLQRHPTLERIRFQFQQGRLLQYAQEQSFGSNSLGTMLSEKLFSSQILNQGLSYMRNTSELRMYYDPLQQKWIRWRS